MTEGSADNGYVGNAGSRRHYGGRYFDLLYENMMNDPAIRVNYSQNGVMRRKTV